MYLLWLINYSDALHKSFTLFKIVLIVSRNVLRFTINITLIFSSKNFNLLDYQNMQAFREYQTVCTNHRRNVYRYSFKESANIINYFFLYTLNKWLSEVPNRHRTDNGKMTKNRLWWANHYTKNNRTWTSLKSGSELMYSGRVYSSCSNSVTLVLLIMERTVIWY